MSGAALSARSTMRWIESAGATSMMRLSSPSIGRINPGPAPASTGRPRTEAPDSRCGGRHEAPGAYLRGSFADGLQSPRPRVHLLRASRSLRCGASSGPSGHGTERHARLLAIRDTCDCDTPCRAATSVCRTPRARSSLIRSTFSGVKTRGTVTRLPGRGVRARSGRWIPAFAGMTVGEAQCDTRHSCESGNP